MITRDIDPDDRRIIRVNLTDAGRERSKCDLEEMRSAICWIFSQMGERRTREFVDLLSEFSTYMAICPSRRSAPDPRWRCGQRSPSVTGVSPITCGPSARKAGEE